MNLDTCPLTKEWINTLSHELPKYNNLQKLEVVYSELRNKPDIEKKAQKAVTACTSTQTNKDRAYNYIPYTSIEEIKDQNQCDIKDLLNVEIVDLSRFWELEHIGILPEDKEPSV